METVIIPAAALELLISAQWAGTTDTADFAVQRIEVL